MALGRWRGRAHATWASVFGVVPDRGIRRRSSDVARALTAAIAVAAGAVWARNYTALEQAVHAVLADLPGPLVESFRFLNGAGVVLTIVVLAGAALAARRVRMILSLAAAGLLGTVLTLAVQRLTDAPGSVDAASIASLTVPYPDYPTLRLVVVAALFWSAAPELTRPSRRLAGTAVVAIAASAYAVTSGLPAGVVGSLALGWGVAALVRLAFGSPAGVPDPAQVTEALGGLGFAVAEVTPRPTRGWGEVDVSATTVDGDVLRVVVIGRDATDARLLSKAWRFLWYKDSGPSLALTRPQQIEHRAYLLLLAERGAAPVPSVLVAGAAGPRRDAVLVTRDTGGQPLDQLPDGAVDAGLLDAAWTALGELHTAGLTHGSIGAEALERLADGRVGFVDLPTADASPDDDARLADQVTLLVVTALLAGEEPALDAAERALGTEGLGALLPVFQPPVLPRPVRRAVTDRKLVGRLRDETARRAGTEEPELVALRRVSWAGFGMAVATLFGVYLLIGQLAEVDYQVIFEGAIWGWVPVVALFSQLPQFGSAIAMLGSVSRPLPLRPVVILNYANNFTGLIGGTVATTAMVVRFFQRQGMGPAVAVSSGVLSSVAALVIQTIFVVTGLLFTSASFDLASGGGVTSGLLRLLLWAIPLAAVVVGIVVVVPRLRRWFVDLVKPQIESAVRNLRSVVTSPRKGLELFGGNFIAQLFFALVLLAALHVYGASLPIMQLIVINSLASVIGGIAPVPGGLGVMEAGLIAGMTAAGVPQDQAVAATFTARMFTAYLPPIWGWFALNWLRNHDYV